MSAEQVVAAAERLNQTNVAAAQAKGTRLYRDEMSPEARALDEAFQAYYEAQQPSTTGPRSIPPISPRREISASEIGITLAIDDETRRQIQEIEHNAALARANAHKFLFD